jgi:hypothetical protein
MAYNPNNLGVNRNDLVDFDPYRGRGEGNPSTVSNNTTTLNRREFVYFYLLHKHDPHCEKFNSSKKGKDKRDTAFYYKKDDLLTLIEKSSTPLRRRGLNRLELLTNSNGLINRELFIDTVERYGDASFLIEYCKTNKPISK